MELVSVSDWVAFFVAAGIPSEKATKYAVMFVEQETRGAFQFKVQGRWL